MSNYIESVPKAILIEGGYQALELLKKLAPNGGEQAVLSEIYNQAYGEGGSARALEVMSTILSDGMTYGNWPWITLPEGTVRTSIPEV